MSRVELIVEGINLTHMVESIAITETVDTAMHFGGVGKIERLTVRLKAEFLDPDGEAFRHLKGLRKAKAKK